MIRLSNTWSKWVYLCSNSHENQAELPSEVFDAGEGDDSGAVADGARQREDGQAAGLAPKGRL